MNGIEQLLTATVPPRRGESVETTAIEGAEEVSFLAEIDAHFLTETAVKVAPLNSQISARPGADQLIADGVASPDIEVEQALVDVEIKAAPAASLGHSEVGLEMRVAADLPVAPQDQLKTPDVAKSDAELSQMISAEPNRMPAPHLVAPEAPAKLGSVVAPPQQIGAQPESKVKAETVANRLIPDQTSEVTATVVKEQPAAQDAPTKSPITAQTVAPAVLPKQDAPQQHPIQQIKDERPRGLDNIAEVAPERVGPATAISARPEQISPPSPQAFPLPLAADPDRGMGFDTIAIQSQSAVLGDRASIPNLATTQAGLSTQQFQTAQVSNAISVHIEKAVPGDGPQQIELRLDPEELGKLRITFTPREAGFLVSLGAERPETLELLRRHAGEFMQDLDAMGLGGSQLEFQDKEGGQAMPESDDEPGAVFAGPVADVPSLQTTLNVPGDDRLDIRL